MKVYYRTRYTKHMIFMKFYADAECTDVIGTSRFSNNIDRPLTVNVLKEWYHTKFTIPLRFKNCNMLWLDHIEITNYRLHGLFRTIIRLTIDNATKILQKNNISNVVICLQAECLDRMWGPTTKKLAKIYREFDFVTAKSSAKYGRGSHVMYRFC